MPTRPSFCSFGSGRYGALNQHKAEMANLIRPPFLNQTDADRRAVSNDVAISVDAKGA